MSVSLVKTRIRISHKEYGWVGETDLNTVANGVWYTCKWDNGNVTREHGEDINLKDGSNG